ncbi:hypothetical protein [Stanieria cyanosphaera]|nr:hypothetical protein [Stanieria cyanosphaera]
MNRRYWPVKINSFQFQLSNKLTTNLRKYLCDRLSAIYTAVRRQKTNYE